MPCSGFFFLVEVPGSGYPGKIKWTLVPKIQSQQKKAPIAECLSFFLEPPVGIEPRFSDGLVHIFNLVY
jgi:hypothetical protein